ncbi:hypothetical protein N7490_009164 [Penicillium lividum]|nr:hypothetical protein N7490_009164 [Penicillium lividum]
MSSNDLGLLEVCSPEKATIHIVLIHGLNGGRSKTWTNKQNQFWPTWIGQQIPGARVWVYGYNANVWFNGSHDHIVLHAKKLLSYGVSVFTKDIDLLLFIRCSRISGLLWNATSRIYLG